MTHDVKLFFGLLITAHIGLVGFWAVKRGPAWARSLNTAFRGAFSGPPPGYLKGFGCLGWLLLTVYLGVELLRGGEWFIVVLFIAPLAVLVVGVIGMLVLVYALTLVLGWLLLVASTPWVLRYWRRRKTDSGLY